MDPAPQRASKKKTSGRTRPTPTSTRRRTVLPSCKSSVATRTRCYQGPPTQPNRPTPAHPATRLRPVRVRATVSCSKACSMPPKSTCERTPRSSWTSRTRLRASAPTSAKWSESTSSKTRTDTCGSSSAQTMLVERFAFRKL